MLLSDRVALVTGAGRGIGAATAMMLAEQGASVVVNDLDADEAQATVASITSAGGSALLASGDLTASSTPAQLIEAAVDGFGGLDIIVNNAGYIWNGAMHNHSDEQFDAMLDMHVGAPFRLLRAYAPWLKTQAKQELEQHGQIRCRKVVNVSSVSGTQGAATQIGYSAGKAAIVGLTKTLSKEWGRYNVTVNAVAFGHIQTRLTQPYDDVPPSIKVGERDFRVGLTASQISGMQQTVPLKRSGTPEDGAGALVLFCLPQSDYVSGQVLTCSGGL